MITPESVRYGTRATAKRDRKKAIIGWVVGASVAGLYFWVIVFIF